MEQGFGMVFLLSTALNGLIHVVVLCLQIYDTDCQHICSHVPPKDSEVVYNVVLESSHNIKKRSISTEWQPLRIHLVYDRTISNLPSAKQELIKDTIIPKGVTYWEETLSVRQASGPIRLYRGCKTTRVRYIDGDPHPYCMDGCSTTTFCGENRVPEGHLEACREAPEGRNFTVKGYAQEGVLNTDFVLYVSAYHTSRCKLGTTVAYAAYCQLESQLDRPIAGYVNLCPDGISTRHYDKHQVHSTIKHEILHALGFSAGLYAFYRDEHGQPLTSRLRSTGKPSYDTRKSVYKWSSKVIKQVTHINWRVRGMTFNKTVNVMATPNVVREVRNHFNCSTLEGAELEDQGIPGTELTHWEKRMFENEMMTGTFTQNPVVSRVTLALMEDTGWYKADYNKADKLEWGKDLGCDFVHKSCHDWMQTRKAKGKSVHPFCDHPKSSPLKTECNTKRSAMALCNMMKFDYDLPHQYQYFTDVEGAKKSDIGHYGGSVSLADYCPFVQIFSWKKNEEVVRGSACSNALNKPEAGINHNLEDYGNESLCFEHGDQWKLLKCNQVFEVEHYGAGCYKYECLPNVGLVIHVFKKSYRCYKAGQKHRIIQTLRGWLHNGTVVCPQCSEICTNCPPDKEPPQTYTVDENVKVPCVGSRTSIDYYTLCSILLGLLLYFLDHNTPGKCIV